MKILKWSVFLIGIITLAVFCAYQLQAGGIPRCYWPCYYVANTDANTRCDAQGGCDANQFDQFYDESMQNCLAGSCIGGGQAPARSQQQPEKSKPQQKKKS